MKNKIKSLFNKKSIAILLISVTCIVLYVLLQHFGEVQKIIAKFFDYIAPAIAGVVIAYLINPLVDFLSKKCFKKMKRRRVAEVLSVVISIVLIIALFITLVVIIIPEVYQSAMTLLTNMDSYMNVFKDFLSGLTEKFDFIDIDVDKIVGNWDNTIDKIIEWVKANATNILNLSVNIGSTIIEAIISFIIAIYILLGKENIMSYTKRVFRAFMKPANYDRLGVKMHYIHGMFIKYIISEIIDATIIFIANYVFMLIFNMPYQLLISVTVAITNLIPTFGPFIGGIPSVLLILIINPMDAVIFGIWTIGLQFVDGYAIRPLLMGDALGLSPALALVSIIVGGKMFGIVGMLLAMPVVTTFVYIFNEFLEKKEKEKNCLPVTEGPPEGDVADGESQEDAPPQSSDEETSEENAEEISEEKPEEKSEESFEEPDEEDEKEEEIVIDHNASEDTSEVEPQDSSKDDK